MISKGEGVPSGEAANGVIRDRPDIKSSHFLSKLTMYVPILYG